MIRVMESVEIVMGNGVISVCEDMLWTARLALLLG